MRPSVVTPPIVCRYSMPTTEHPFSSAAIAAGAPAVPMPTTTTSATARTGSSPPCDAQTALEDAGRPSGRASRSRTSVPAAVDDAAPNCSSPTAASVAALPAASTPTRRPSAVATPGDTSFSAMARSTSAAGPSTYRPSTPAGSNAPIGAAAEDVQLVIAARPTMRSGVT